MPRASGAGSARARAPLGPDLPPRAEARYNGAMHRLTTVVPVLAMLAICAVAGCKKEEEPQAIPVPSASAPAPVAPADSAAADATAAATASAAPTPPAATAPVQHASIDACCNALAAIQHSGRDAATKKKASQAARVCPGIAARVKSGQVARSSALVQVLSAMTGASIPAECH